MNTKNLSSIVNGIKDTLSQHSPEILTGIGIAGMITTTILAVAATPKAVRLIEAKKKDTNTEKLTVGDTVKTTWKCYVPAVVTGALATTCLIGASSVHVKRTAALATAYKLSETALTEYKTKVIETIGEKKEQAVKDKVLETKVQKDPVSSHNVIITSNGTTLCYDGVFGRYFNSDMDTIKRAVNAINRTVVQDGYVSLNEFYDEIGLPQVNIGDELGWNIDDGEIMIDFSSTLAENNTPCLVIYYNVTPKRGYSSFYR